MGREILAPCNDIRRAEFVRAGLLLGVLPREHGIDALHDHAGEMRYIGVTAKDRLGFTGRINGRHVGGSESRSHKFSHAYNTGRMWRSKKDVGPDGRLAKSVRMAFARRYCRATYVTVPAHLHEHLTRLEAAVQALAPVGQLAWGNETRVPPLRRTRRPSK